MTTSLMFWSGLSAIVALGVMWAGVALLRGGWAREEPLTLVKTDCCHESKAVADVVIDESRPWISFVCKDPSTCKRAGQSFKSAS